MIEQHVASLTCTEFSIRYFENVVEQLSLFLLYLIDLPQPLTGIDLAHITELANKLDLSVIPGPMDGLNLTDILTPMNRHGLAIVPEPMDGIDVTDIPSL